MKTICSTTRIISELTGKSFTKAEAIAAYQRHLDGEGGNTVGYKLYPKELLQEASESDITQFGDALINMGRMLETDKY